MNPYKFTWRFWFFLVFFTVVVLLGVSAIYMLMTNQVAYEDGKTDLIASLLLGTALSVVLLTYLLSLIVMYRQLFKYEGCGLTITAQGIENTLVFVNILAFLIVAPVKRIPWEAVTYYDDEDAPYIRVKVKQVQAGFFAKAILFMLGYHFCLSFVKPAVTADDLHLYKHRFTIGDING